MSRTVAQIAVTAHLEQDPADELERVRKEAEGGDRSWQQWLDEHEAGAAMLLTLEVAITVRAADGSEEQLARTNHNVWIEDHAHPPKVEQQVAEVAGKDFESLAEELRERGLDIVAEDLDEMLATVTLGDDVLAALSGEHIHHGEAPAARPGLTTAVDED
jgi:hypothetical protein